MRSDVVRQMLLGSMISLVQKISNSGHRTFEYEVGFVDKSIWDIQVGFSVENAQESVGYRIVVRDHECKYVGFLLTCGEYFVEGNYEKEFITMVFELFDVNNYSIAMGPLIDRPSDYIMLNIKAISKTHMANFEGKVIKIIPANTIPSWMEVKFFFFNNASKEEMLADDRLPYLFAPCEYDRLVLKSGKEHYVVPFNRRAYNFIKIEED